MPTQPLPADFAYLPEMYADNYFPPQLVDKVRAPIQKVVAFLEKDSANLVAIQKQLDKMTSAINKLQDDFEEAGSELETVARDSIAETVGRVLTHFDVAIDVEDALGEREW